MRKIKRGNMFEYIFEGEYVKHKISKKDQKCTKFATSCYKLVKRLHLEKFFENKKWFRFLDKQVFSNFSMDENRFMQEDVDPTLDIEQLVYYDILPKEYLEEYKQKFLIYRQRFSKTIFKDNNYRVKKHFEELKSENIENMTANIDYLQYDENNNKLKCSQFFKHLEISFIGLTQSFFVVKYTLTPSDYLNILFKAIKSEKIFKAPTISTNNKWWRLKDIAQSTDHSYVAKTSTIEEMLLHVKYEFFKEIDKYVYSFAFKNNIVPNGLYIFSSQDISKVTEYRKLFPIHGPYADENTEKQIHVYYNMPSLGGKIKDSYVFVGKQHTEKDDDSQWYYVVDDQICTLFADYFILNSLNQNVLSQVNRSQVTLNTLICKNNSTIKIMKAKNKIDKKLYLFRRLFNEFEFSEKDFKDKIKLYSSDFKPKFLPLKYSGLEFAYDTCLGKFQEIKKQLKNIYDYFNESLNSISNYSTMRIIFWTLCITILSCALAVLSANDWIIFSKIIEFFKNLFT